jgi:hypothetical protein
MAPLVLSVLRSLTSLKVFLQVYLPGGNGARLLSFGLTAHLSQVKYFFFQILGFLSSFSDLKLI